MDYIQSSSLSGALDQLWYRFLPEMEGRLAILTSAADAYEAGSLSDAQREEAHSAAHKLAGVLGTFGLSRGTTLARELEELYAEPVRHSFLKADQFAAATAELRTIVGSRN